jgi:hypothetical protein
MLLLVRDSSQFLRDKNAVARPGRGRSAAGRLCPSIRSPFNAGPSASPAAGRLAAGWPRRGLVGTHRCVGFARQCRVPADRSCEVQACEDSDGLAAKLYLGG